MSGTRKDDLRPRLAQLLNKHRQAPTKGEDHSTHKASDVQAEVRSLLERSRQEGRLDRRSLNELSDRFLGQKEGIDLPKTRLSLATNRNMNIKRFDEINRQDRVDKIATGSTQNSVSKKTNKLKEVPKSKRNLRDSIYFKSELEYETYLREELASHGLFRELFEQLKVLYVARRDLHALMGLFHHLPELELSECQINLEIAETFRLLDDMDKAYLYLDKAVRADPQSILAIRSLAFYHKLKEEYELSLHWFLELKKLCMQDAEVHYQLGIVYHRVGQDHLALVSVRKSLDLDTKHMLARSLMEKLL
jgi:tetratricopeptide (TPR) repeat protein